jgi:Fe-S oxidoreductase
MATREEADSTRGRANALRLAISGQLGPAGLTDPELASVLDLCLECKACGSECPTGVDMARLKSEFLHQFQRIHGTPLRSRVLGAAELGAVWGSRLAPASGWIQSSRLVRWLLDIALGIDRRRPLPQATRHTFRRQWRRHRLAPAGEGETTGRRMILFVDTFTNFYEPDIPLSAVRLASKLGWSVSVPPRVCCGRPLISKGLLDRARVQAEATSAALAGAAAEGTPIAFCEPGCFSAVRDDHPRLVRPHLRAVAESVAAAAVTVEEWAASALDATARPAPTAAEAGPVRVLVHGHCHQKALVGMDPTAALLARIPEAEVTVLDGGCCGMAGSFGYEREHYALSEQIGELRLFPALRERPADTIVVASGFSCRHQIRHFTDTEPLTPVQIVEPLIGTGA